MDAPVVATAAPARPPQPPATRLLSLDVFRGATIAGMLLVNNPGSWSAIYDPLEHAAWHGWTPTDLIFPFFLFIVGVSITFSFATRAAHGSSRHDLMLNALRRAAVLFALGLLLHGFPSYDLTQIRIPGVLQRIALAYLGATAIVLYLRTHAQVALLAALLLGYWALLTLVPVPGGFPGVLEKGQDLAAYIDRAVFGQQHLWRGASGWDPEGLLSTLPAIGTVLLGVFAGRWLRSERDAATRTVGLFLAGNLGLVLGVCWHVLFPINKNLWTSSYVVFTAGMACHFLAVCYWLVDVKGFRRWAMPFVIYGVNAIAVFVLSGLFARVLGIVRVPRGAATVTLKTYIYDALFTSWLAPINASLAYAICFVLFWLGLMAVLYRRRIFIKV